MTPITRASLKSLLSALALIAGMPAHGAPPLACGTTVYAPVSLTADLVCGPGQGGLIVGDHNVRIELNGYSILGPFNVNNTSAGFATGISSSGFERVEIVGPGLITGFIAPIEIEGGNNHVISDVAAIEEWGRPVLLRNASGALITRSRILRLQISSDPGQRATANRVIDNVIGADPEAGFGFLSLQGCGTADNMIAYNSFVSPYGDAVHLFGGPHGNQVIKNKMDRSQVYLRGASDNLVADNTFLNDSKVFASVVIEPSGFQIACAGGAVLASEKNMVRGNRVRYGQIGVYIGDYNAFGPSSANTVTGNVFFGQTHSALYFDFGANDNEAHGNTYANTPVIAYDYGSGNQWP